MVLKLVLAVLALLAAVHGVQVVIGDDPRVRNGTGLAAEVSSPAARACALEMEAARPPILPSDLGATSWADLAARHLIRWLPEQKTTTSRSGYDFTGLGMCPALTVGPAVGPAAAAAPLPRRRGTRLLWFTAITAVERGDAGRSENYLTGVRAMVLSALRNRSV